MEFRIKKYNRGFVVEVKKQYTKWFKTKYRWVHFISVAGIDSLPWYYKTYKNAEEGLLFKIKCETISNSK